MSRKGTPRSRRWRGKSFAAEILRLTKLAQREIVRIGLSRRRAASSTSYQGDEPRFPSQRISSSGISIRRYAGVRDKRRTILFTLKEGISKHYGRRRYHRNRRQNRQCITWNYVPGRVGKPTSCPRSHLGENEKALYPSYHRRPR